MITLANIIGPLFTASGVAINVWAYAAYGSPINIAAGVFCFLMFLTSIAITLASLR